MRFTVLQSDFQKGINTVSKAISIRASLPILSNILISTDGGRLKLSATDLDKSITTWIGAKVDEEGSVTIPAKILFDFVSNLSPVQIQGSVENNILTLKSQKAEASFNGVDASEFPMPQNLNKGKSAVSIPSKQFQEALSEVAFSAAAEDSRPILTGVLMHIENKELIMVSVDGFRLSERVLSLDKEYKKAVEFVVPARTLVEISRICSNSKEPISISLLEAENLVVFESEDVIATSRMLEGSFPDYKKIIPQGSNLKIDVALAELLNAVKIANVFARDASNVVKVAAVSGEGLFVSSEAYEVGQNKTFVDAKVDGENMEIIFDGRFLNDFLSNVKCEDLVIETEGALNPAAFRPVKRKNYIHIIMPRRP